MVKRNEKTLPSANGTANTDGKSSLGEVTVVERRSSAAEVARRVDGFVWVRCESIVAVVHPPVRSHPRRLRFPARQNQIREMIGNGGDWRINRSKTETLRREYQGIFELVALLMRMVVVVWRHCQETWGSSCVDFCPSYSVRDWVWAILNTEMQKQRRDKWNEFIYFFHRLNKMTEMPMADSIVDACWLKKWQMESIIKRTSCAWKSGYGIVLYSAEQHRTWLKRNKEKSFLHKQETRSTKSRKGRVF